MLDEIDQRRKDEYVAGLRELADWLESRPELEKPVGMITILWPAYCVEDFAKLRRESGLTDKRDYAGTEISFFRKFTGGHEAIVYCSKELTCERKKVGERVIAARPEQLIPAQPEQIEEVFEWECNSILEKLHEPIAEEAPQC
jgi:hypothetical protein